MPWDTTEPEPDLRGSVDPPPRPLRRDTDPRPLRRGVNPPPLLPRGILRKPLVRTLAESDAFRFECRKGCDEDVLSHYALRLGLCIR